jgi:hypothetical protein
MGLGLEKVPRGCLLSGLDWSQEKVQERSGNGMTWGRASG